MRTQLHQSIKNFDFKKLIKRPLFWVITISLVVVGLAFFRQGYLSTDQKAIILAIENVGDTPSRIDFVLNDLSLATDQTLVNGNAYIGDDYLLIDLSVSEVDLAFAVAFQSIEGKNYLKIDRLENLLAVMFYDDELEQADLSQWQEFNDSWIDLSDLGQDEEFLALTDLDFKQMFSSWAEQFVKSTRVTDKSTDDGLTTYNLAVTKPQALEDAVNNFLFGADDLQTMAMLPFGLGGTLDAFGQPGWAKQLVITVEVEANYLKSITAKSQGLDLFELVIMAKPQTPQPPIQTPDAQHSLEDLLPLMLNLFLGDFEL